MNLKMLNNFHHLKSKVIPKTCLEIPKYFTKWLFHWKKLFYKKKSIALYSSAHIWFGAKLRCYS